MCPSRSLNSELNMRCYYAGLKDTLNDVIDVLQWFLEIELDDVILKQLGLLHDCWLSNKIWFSQIEQFFAKDSWCMLIWGTHPKCSPILSRSRSFVFYICFRMNQPSQAVSATWLNYETYYMFPVRSKFGSSAGKHCWAWKIRVWNTWTIKWRQIVGANFGASYGSMAPQISTSTIMAVAFGRLYIRHPVTLLLQILTNSKKTSLNPPLPSESYPSGPHAKKPKSDIFKMTGPGCNYDCICFGWNFYRCKL